MLKSLFNCGIRLVLWSILLIFSVSGCAISSFKISEKREDIRFDKDERILLVATSLDYDFANLLMEDVYNGLQKKNLNILKYPDVLPAISFNKDGDNTRAFCKENGIKYIIRLENITCVKSTGYMPPSQKLETYSYYSNGKLQTGTRTVSVPGYYYTYLQAYLLIKILEAETENSLVKAQVTTTGSMSAVESHIAKSIANKIAKKIAEVL